MNSVDIDEFINLMRFARSMLLVGFVGFEIFQELMQLVTFMVQVQLFQLVQHLFLDFLGLPVQRVDPDFFVPLD